MLTPVLCRMSRAALGWSRDQLAAASNLTTETLRRFESADRALHVNHLSTLTAALKEAGIEFATDEHGRPCVHFPEKQGKTKHLGKTRNILGFTILSLFTLFNILC